MKPQHKGNFDYPLWGDYLPDGSQEVWEWRVIPNPPVEYDVNGHTHQFTNLSREEVGMATALLLKDDVNVHLTIARSQPRCDWFLKEIIPPAPVAVAAEEGQEQAT